ncbi:uncharacterized protein [Asterias amurensis]|uniref:uncharacterized protein n=1 Tax=Asterias amurensis TaxID=7602 RepID=UPI003AB2384D
MSTKPSPRPATRYARPIVSVKHRFLAWDKPQFVVENSSRDIGFSPTPSNSSRNSKARNVKLTVTRSADRVIRGRGAITDDKFSPAFLPKRSSANNQSHSKPVIINDLWKPLSSPHPVSHVKTTGDNDYVVRSHLNSEPSRPMSGFEKFNARTEAQLLLRNPRSTLQQFLRSPAARTAERNDSGSPYHHGNQHSNKIGHVAGYQIYGKNAPKSTVYNLNEHIVSETDMSSLSFVSSEQNKESLENVSSPDLIFDYKQNGTKTESRYVESVVNNRNTDMSTVSDTKSHRQVAKQIKRVSFRKMYQGKSADRTAIDMPSSEDEVDTYTPIRVSVTVPSSACRSDGDLSSPISVDEISEVGRENGIEETTNDCSMCPMCRAQAATKEGVSARLVHSEHQETATIDKTDETSVDILTKTENTTMRQENVSGGFKCQTTQSQSDPNPASSNESSSIPSNNKPATIDSYGEKLEPLSDKKVSPRAKQYHAGLGISKFDSKSLINHQNYNPYSHKDTVPKKRNPAMVVNGNGLARSNDLERYRPSPLHSRRWFVDAARPLPHSSLRNTDPASQIPLHLSAESLSNNHRVPLLIWKKMQQREGLVPPHYGNTRARLGGNNDGMTMNSVGHNQMVIHIPTAEYQRDEMDCPPNTPIPE